MSLKGSENRIGVSSCYNIRLHIIVLGYKKKGESILILFEDTEKEDNRIVYSVVVDSYVYEHGKNKINKTDEYLRKYKVGRDLSVAVWTHPHLDHSKGFKHILEKYSTTKTKVISAPHFFNQKDDIVKVKGKENIDVVNEIFHMNRFQTGIIGRPSSMKNSYSPIDSITLKGFDSSQFNVAIDAIAPCVSILDGYKADGKTGLNPNEISIAFILSVNDLYFLFAGDTLNDHIVSTDPEYLSNCVFVKIPHHASKTSDSLIGYLDGERLETACVTRFKSGNSNLPDEDILKGYLDLTDNVFSTGDSKHEVCDYGIVEYVYEFKKSNDYEISVHLKGNAYVCE